MFLDAADSLIFVRVMSVLQVDQIRGRDWIIILVGPGKPSLMESPVRVGLVQVVDALSYHSLPSPIPLSVLLFPSLERLEISILVYIYYLY